MELVRRSLKLNVYGNEYNLDFPTVKKTQEYAASLDKVGDEGSVEAVLLFLEDLGLPKNITEEMEPEHLGQVIEALVPSKKKVTPPIYFNAKLARFYGWNYEKIESMPYAKAMEYYESITVIEAQESLVRMNVSDYPNMKNEARRKYHREMKKMAQPPELRKEMSFEEFIGKMTDGR